MLTQIRRLFRRAAYGRPIIVVSGLPRSGTSMAMKMLEAAELPMVVDGLRAADVDNPKGYFELERVKNLAQEKDKSYLHEARGKVVKIISYLLKELPSNNNYKVIFMRRHLDEVLASQQKMLTHRSEDSGAVDEKMREFFETDLWRAKYLIRRSPHLDALEVHYSEALADPQSQARRIAEFLGGALDVRKMAAVVDPDLYRNRAPETATG